MRIKLIIIILASCSVVLIPTQDSKVGHPASITSIVTPALKPLSKLPETSVAPKALLASKVVVKPPSPVLAPPAASQSNEQIAWDFLIARYSRNQTAGIMGNLAQEHGFQTSDVAGGLGIAQWMGNRRTNLIAKGNHLDITVQLQHLHEEMAGISLPDNLVGATVVFQNQFERCGNCQEPKRIQFAQEILGRH